MEKQVSRHPTMLKRQDLRGLLKSDLRDETQTCANWRSRLAGDCWPVKGFAGWRRGGRRKWRMLEIR